MNFKKFHSLYTIELKQHFLIKKICLNHDYIKITNKVLDSSIIFCIKNKGKNFVIMYVIKNFKVLMINFKMISLSITILYQLKKHKQLEKNL